MSNEKTTLHLLDSNLVKTSELQIADEAKNLLSLSAEEQNEGTPLTLEDAANYFLKHQVNNTISNTNNEVNINDDAPTINVVAVGPQKSGKSTTLNNLFVDDQSPLLFEEGPNVSSQRTTTGVHVAVNSYSLRTHLQGEEHLRNTRLCHNVICDFEGLSASRPKGMSPQDRKEYTNNRDPLSRRLQVLAITMASIILYFVRDTPDDFFQKFVKSLDKCKDQLSEMKEKPALFILFMQQDFPDDYEDPENVENVIQALEEYLDDKNLDSSMFFSLIEAFDVPDFEKKAESYNESIERIRTKCFEAMKTGDLGAKHDPSSRIPIRRFDCLHGWTIILDAIVDQVNSDESVSDICDIQLEKSQIRCEQSKTNAMEFYKNNAQKHQKGITDHQHKEYMYLAIKQYVENAFGAFLPEKKKELTELCFEAFQQRYKKCDAMCITQGCEHFCTQGRVDHTSSHRCNRTVDRAPCIFKDLHGCVKGKMVKCGEASVPFDCGEHCTRFCLEHHNICILPLHEEETSHRCKECCTKKCTGECGRYCIEKRSNHTSDHSCGENIKRECTYSSSCTKMVSMLCGGANGANNVADCGQCCSQPCDKCWGRTCNIGRGHPGQKHICSQCCGATCDNCGKNICARKSNHSERTHACSKCCPHRGETCVFLSGSNDSTIKLWNRDTSQCIRTFNGHTSQVLSVCVMSDNPTQFLSSSADNTIKLWNRDTGQCIRTFNGHTNHVTSLCVLSDNPTQFLTGSTDKTIKLWNRDTGQCIRTFNGHTHTVWSVCVMSDNPTQFLSCSNDNTIKLWNRDTGQCIRTFNGHTHWVWSVCVMSDNPTQFLSCSTDNTIKLWNRDTGQCIRTFNGHTSAVLSVCVMSDNPTQFLSSSADSTIKLWNRDTGQCIRTFNGHTNTVLSVCVMSDNPTQFLSGSNDNTIKLWNRDTGDCIRTFNGHTDLVWSVVTHQSTI